MRAKFIKDVLRIHEGYEYAGAESDEEGYDDMHIDSPNYWEAVAAAMGGSLESFNVDHDEEKRHIVISMGNNGNVDILHDWREDGTESKPWTYVNGDDRFGRLAIWEDSPEDYAEDIMKMV